MIIGKSFPLFYLVTLTTLFSFSVRAENHLLLMGGGGEPTGESTIFDSGLNRFSNNLNSAKWKYDISFNGGHTKTENILKTQFSKAQTSSDFTPAKYKELIDSYKAKILLGDIKPGDQLMIIIDTHGAINDGRQKTHLIAAKGKTAGDMNKLSDADLVNLDALEELVKLTNDRGITMGIVDLSCHSGISLKLKSPNTCVVTATGPSHYGFAGGNSFSDMFLANLAPGKTMEQAFLKARAESIDASYPMISTDEHESIAREVYKNITPYLYYYDSKADKMTEFLTDVSKDQVICQRENQFANLINKIESMNKLLPQSRTNDLKNLITIYKSQQDKIIGEIKNLGGHQLSQKETITTPITGGKGKPVSWNYTWKEIIDTDTDKYIKSFQEKALRAKTAQDKAEALAVAENYRKLHTRKEAITALYPNIKSYESESKKLVKSLGENRATAEKIAAEEKKFYDELYRSKQSLNFNDPCRRLVF